jgi:WD40 repeat protein
MKRISLGIIWYWVKHLVIGVVAPVLLFLAGCNGAQVEPMMTPTSGFIEPDEFIHLALDFLSRQVGPYAASIPHPANGATDVRIDPTLSWTAGDKAAGHDVYFSTVFNDVNDAGRGNDPAGVLISKGQPGTTYKPGILDFNTTYYWRVDEVNEPNIWKGPVWSFSTGSYVVVDDFEDYNNISPHRLCQSWFDGVGFSSDSYFPIGFSGNGTNAAVGHAICTAGSPNLNIRIMENNIVHSGRQSMPLYYDNTKSSFISRTDRIFTDPQDWSRKGMESLNIWVRGNQPLLGDYVYNSATGLYTVTGAGADIWGPSDQFHYVYKRLSGNGYIQAKVLSLANTGDPNATNAWAKAGVMIRETLDADSIFAAVFVTGGQGCHFQARRITGEEAIADSWGENDVDTDEQNAIVAPYWIKLERAGDTFNGYYSADGSTWTKVAWSPQMIPMSQDVYIGLALTGHAPGIQCKAEFLNVTTAGRDGGTVTAPDQVRGWQSQDIGIQSNDKEPMYAVIKDNGTAAAIVSNPDPNAVITADWQAWSINLADQVASAGVDLKNIKQLSIGIGDPKATSPGGKGLVYIDDIRPSGLSPVLTSVHKLFELNGSPGPVWSLAWSPDGSMLASAGFGQVKLWDAKTRKELGMLKGHSDDVWGVAWSPDGSKIASSGEDGTIRLWDAKTREGLATFETGKWTLCVTWSPDGSRLACGNSDGDLQVWDVKTGEVVHRLIGAKGYSVISVAWSPDGRILAAGQWNGVVYLWNSKTGEQVGSLVSNPKERNDVNGLAWSPNGRMLASAHQDGKIRLWSLADSKVPHILGQHSGAARGLAWSPDGHLLASTGIDSKVRLWDVKTGLQLSILKDLSLWVLSIAWSPDGKKIAAGNGKYAERIGGAVVVWAVP